MKRCSKCKVEKPLSDFYRNRAAKDGVQGHCKVCILAYRRDNPDRIVAANTKAYAKRYASGAPPVASKRCPRCGQEKPAEGFHRARGGPDGLASRCRECTKPDSAKWYAENRERDRERNRAWRAENYERVRANWAAYRAAHLEEHNEAGRRRHARKKSTDHGCVTTEKLTALFDQHQGRCAYCYIPITRRTMQWDHVVPLAVGGPHCIKNLAPSCTPCNASKNKHPLDEWLAKQSVLF